MASGDGMAFVSGMTTVWTRCWQCIAQAFVDNPQVVSHSN